MLQNIFLLRGKKIQDFKDLDIYCYPNEIIKNTNEDLINDIIIGHEKGELNYKSKSYSFWENRNHYKIDIPVAQIIENLNLYTLGINGNTLIGLIFDKEDNPYDYKIIFEEQLIELLNNSEGYSFDDETEIENLLLSMFIDIRRFGDEVIEKPSEIEYYYQKETFFKVFLFGIDEVGKSSLVRRLKTGDFNENFFTPTRKFNIEYIPVEEEGSLLAMWDMPGQKLFRSKWLKGLQDSNVLVYMIDIANQRRFKESKQEFWDIINKTELNGVPLIIIGNKIDLIKYSDSKNDDQLHYLKKEIFDYFDFEKIKNREWIFLFTSVKTNFNMEKLIQTIFHLVS
ncbi:MAG: ADP-ribosylation factor-like protein [Promethearchaeota archaeon]